MHVHMFLLTMGAYPGADQHALESKQPCGIPGKSGLSYMAVILLSFTRLMSFPSRGHCHALLRVLLCCAPYLRMAASQPSILLRTVLVRAGFRKNSCSAGELVRDCCTSLLPVPLLSCLALRFKTPKALPSADAEISFPLPQCHAVAMCMYGSCSFAHSKH